jgi:hypothetical protein
MKGVVVILPYYKRLGLGDLTVDILVKYLGQCVLIRIDERTHYLEILTD